MYVYIYVDVCMYVCILYTILVATRRQALSVCSSHAWAVYYYLRYGNPDGVCLIRVTIR